MEGQQQLDTTMVEYQQLQAPQALNEGLLSQLDSHIKGKHWSASFQCITMIRAVCKYHPECTPDIFIRYGPVIMDLFNHGATQLVKNILKLLQQIFSQGEKVNVQNCVGAFLPVLARRSTTESGVIKEMCQQIMTIIAMNCTYVTTIEVAAQLSINDKVAASVNQMALKMLAAMLTKIGGAITQINPNTLQGIMKGMSLLINGKRNNMRTNALDLCLFIYNQIGSENYLQLMNYSLPQNEIMQMGQAMETHRTQKQKAPHLSDVLKQRKQDRMSGHYSQNMMR